MGKAAYLHFYLTFGKQLLIFCLTLLLYREINSILFSTNLVQQTTCGTIKVLFKVGKETLKTEVRVMHGENHNIYFQQHLNYKNSSETAKS